MSYILRQSKKTKGIYLQIYENYWDKTLKQPRSKNVKPIGYVSDLVTDTIPDPISYYKEYVRKMNEDNAAMRSEANRPRAFCKNININVGHFLLNALLTELNVKRDIDYLASVRQFQFSTYDLISQLIFSRIVNPCSKSKTVSSVFPSLFKFADISEDQVYDGCNFIGESYKKYIELFNIYYEKIFPRNYNKVYFDCTNYYFEIDLPKEDKQKGPSKENRHDPIIGQALLLDADLIPLAMQMYPGNESEKPYIRKVIEEMKAHYKVKGKTIQVADKGLNCAKNIYAAVKEANDGYIFSKSIHGKGLSNIEKKWLLLENKDNVFTDYFDENGNLKYRIKSCIDDFKYSFKDTDPITGEEKVITFTVREKRVVSYNPGLAKKQKAEIQKIIDKALKYRSYKEYSKEEIGESAKYLKFITEDDSGNKITPKIEINQNQIDEDLTLAGYNLMVTSELNMSPHEIYETYHNLWKIEESFKITKSYLDARPVFVQKKETIYGHFLICYLSLFLLRTLEIKCFRNEINSFEIIDFIRDFNVVDIGNDSYINISQNQKVNGKIKSLTGLNNIDALYLTKQEIENLFNKTILTDLSNK